MDVIAEIAPGRGMVMGSLLGRFVVLFEHTSCEEVKVIGCGRTLETRIF
jgi:hypothetical protein